MPDVSGIERDIADMNFTFLRTCRELARHDKVMAAHRFGVSAHFVDRIIRATTADLQQLAKTGSVMFQPRVGMALEVVLGAILAPEISESGVQNIRTASLLCERPVSAAS